MGGYRNEGRATGQTDDKLLQGTLINGSNNLIYRCMPNHTAQIKESVRRIKETSMLAA